MKLSGKIYSEIQDMAMLTLVTCKVCSIPILGADVAVRLGISLIPYSSLSDNIKQEAFVLSNDGFFLACANGEERIYYNDKMKSERQNMTILHEIAHCVLGHNEGMSLNEEEAEANFFAKCAIAPPILVHEINPSNQDDIHRHFLLSWEAAKYSHDYYKKWLEWYAVSGATKNEDYLVKLFRETNKGGNM